MANTKENSQEISSWNVLTDPWLQVMTLDAEAKHVSPVEALEKARSIHSIVLSSPLDFFAVHRFLLTLLYWKADAVGGVQQVRDLLMKEEIPTDVSKAIKSEASCFNLFDENIPFLQDPSIQKEPKKEPKSPGYLFAEFATGTNIAHFHHGDDKQMRLCLICTTLGMLRVVPWSQAGGRASTPSVCGAPSILILASGKTLAHTLGLNLIPLQGELDTAAWTGYFNPKNTAEKIPYLEAFTWNPRRISLPFSEENQTCWGCGREKITAVGPIFYAINEKTKLRKKEKNKKGTIPFIWQDPSAFYPAKLPYTPKKSSGETWAIDNRDLNFLRDKKPSIENRVLQENNGHKGWHLIVPCTNKAKTYDHRKIEISDFSDVPQPEKEEAPKKGLDGWKELSSAQTKGAMTFVKTAVQIFTPADWSALASAKYHKMSEAPAGFDVFTGLYWSLRNKKNTSHVPQRNVCWLVLKLMATVPASARTQHADASCNPFQSLPKRQLNAKGGKQSPYPRALPQGNRLEAGLRQVLDRHLQPKSPEHIDWAGLCSSIHQQLN